MRKLKELFWNTKISKGKNVFGLFRSTYFRFATVILYTLYPINEKRHQLASPLVVSLTSHHARFSTLHLTLYCLLRQPIKADEIRLNVSKNDYSKIPKKIIRLASQNKIKIYITEDLGPGTKILPTLQENPSSHIVTAVDDLYYHPKWLEALILNWDGKPRTIVAHRIHQIELKLSGEACPYLEWYFNVNNSEPAETNFATGSASVFYPPNCFSPEVLNVDKYKELCLKQDDFWLYWISRKHGSFAVHSGNSTPLVTGKGTQTAGLVNANLGDSKNDICIHKIILNYGYPWKWRKASARSLTKPIEIFAIQKPLAILVD